MGFVYKWTNNLNQKWYIGSHKGHPGDRYIGSGRAFKNAVKKYGIENFTRIILYEGDDYKTKEISILTELNAEKDNKSYNLKNNAKGGFGTLAGKTFEEIYGPEEAKRQKELRRKTLTGHETKKETKDKISKTNIERGIKPSRETIEKAAKSRRGKGLNYVMTEEISNKISMSVSAYYKVHRVKESTKEKARETKRKNKLKPDHVNNYKGRIPYNKGKKVGPSAAKKAWETKRKNKEAQ